MRHYGCPTKLSDELNNSFEECLIKHKKNLTHDVAWLASWISFVTLAKLIKN